MENIEVTLDDEGIFTFSSLPPGTYMTEFTFMDVDQEVLSINAPADYTITVTSTIVGVQYETTGPLTQTSPGVFLLQSGMWTRNQQQAMITAAIPGGPSFGVLINPASIPVSVHLQPGGLSVDKDELPIGMEFDGSHTFTLQAAGNFIFDFWISQISTKGALILTPNGLVPERFSYAPADTHVYVADHNMEVYPELQPPPFSFNFSLDPNNQSIRIDRLVRIDPTIVNNPINQGPGSGGGTVWVTPKESAGLESLALA